MLHRVVSRIPGDQGRFTPVGRYECSCGEILTSVRTFTKHRAEARRAEAIERGAEALFQYHQHEEMDNPVTWDDPFIGEHVRNHYRRQATEVIDAAGPKAGGRYDV